MHCPHWMKIWWPVRAGPDQKTDPGGGCFRSLMIEPFGDSPHVFMQAGVASRRSLARPLEGRTPSETESLMKTEAPLSASSATE